ncbi:MAG: ABC transporter permease [Cyclobacteriaceae bacterium]
MLRNYLNVFLRNVRRNSFFTFLNLLGLTLGIAVSFVIVLYVTDELSFDKFHKDGNEIYRVGLSGVLSGNKFDGVNTCSPLSAALTDEVPAVHSSTRISSWRDLMIHKDGNILMQEKVIVADSNFFQFFTFDLLAGDVNNQFKTPKSLVITQSTAKKLFGAQSPSDIVGQTLLIGNDKESYQITGVAVDPPRNSHFEFKAIVPMMSWDWIKRNTWVSNSLYTYFKVYPETDINVIQAHLDDFVVKYVGPEIQQFLGITLDEFKESGGAYGYFIQPLYDLHFSTYDGEIGANGNKQNVLVFSVVALFVLIIAAVNFINLSTAKASDRAKEIGIRKSVGAYKAQLINQFLFESVLLVFIASVIALFMVASSIDYLNGLTSKEFLLSDVFNANILLFYLAAVIIIGLLAGIYPSLVLSAYKPAEVIKGHVHGASNRRFNTRNVLVGFQFSLTTLAIIITLVISQQLNHMRTFDLGFDKEQLFVISNAKSLPNQETFQNELNNLANVNDASLTFQYPSRVNSNSVFRLGDTNEDLLFYQYYADIRQAESLGLSLNQGRYFEDAQLDENSVVINETAFKQTGWSSIDGKQILEVGADEEGGFNTFNVVGVVNDFHFQDFKNEIKPLIMFCTKDGRFITMRVKGKNALSAISTIEKKWAEFTGGKPFEYTFIDQQFENLFETERRLGNLTLLFSILTIITASLGLFGLAAFVARSRRKEFGIRKILGAHEGTIWMLQFKYFVSIAGISLLIAVPLGYWISDAWLTGFAYRINNGLIIYLLAASVVAVLIFISVGYQSFKAAKMIPSKVLRED